MSEQKLSPLTMKSNPKDEKTFFVLSELHKFPYRTQREIALNIDISLGKANYIIRQLVKKGLIKVMSFSHSPGKLKKVKYILTREGTEEKVRLTYHFLKQKEFEYNRIKKEWEKINSHAMDAIDNNTEKEIA